MRARRRVHAAPPHPAHQRQLVRAVLPSAHAGVRRRAAGGGRTPAPPRVARGRRSSAAAAGARHHRPLVRGARRRRRSSSLDRRWRTRCAARRRSRPAVRRRLGAAGRAAARPARRRWTRSGCRRWPARTRSSPSQWPLWAWAANLGLLAVLWLAHRCRGGAAAAPRRGRGARLGRHGAGRRCSSSRCRSSPPAWRFPVQLQISRVFWLVDVVATIYVRRRAGRTSAIATARRAGRRWPRCWSLAVGRGVYIMLVERPERRAVRGAPAGRRLARRDALAGATAAGASHVLADPGHALEVRHQRPRGGRARRLPRGSEGLGDRDLLARRGRAGRGAHGGDRRLLRADRRRARALAMRYDLDYLVTGGRPAAARGVSRTPSSGSTRWRHPCGSPRPQPGDNLSRRALRSRSTTARASPAATGRRSMRGPTPRAFPRPARSRWRATSIPRRTRACSRTATGTPSRASTSDAHAAPRPRRVEHRALHARHGRQGVGRGLERGAAEPAQLRRHRAPVARPLPLGPDPRSAVRDARAHRHGRPAGGRHRRLLARRQPGAEAGRRARRRGAARSCARSAPSRRRWIWRCASTRWSAASNYPYQWNFVRNLKARMRRKAAAFPDDFSVEPLGRIWTVRQFDEAYTAPHHGFRDATDYYHRASALRVHRPHPRADADPHGRERSVRAAGAVPRPGRHGQPAHHHGDHAATAATARSSSAAGRAATTATGPSARWSGSRRRSRGHGPRDPAGRAHQRLRRTPAPSPPLRA